MKEYKHYIKIDENNNITDAFSSWQKEKFDGTEILYRESSDRHFSLETIDLENGIYRLEFSGNEIIEKDITEEKNLVIEKRNIENQLYQSDKEMSRVTEDLIDLLVSKNSIKKSDLPIEAQEKLNNRKDLREQLYILK